MPTTTNLGGPVTPSSSKEPVGVFGVGLVPKLYVHIMSSPLKPNIAPSILSADFARLGEECERMLHLGAEWLHVDIMDGHFVYNLTIGAPIVKALRERLGPGAFLDCHLMVSNPTRWLNDFKEAGASQITLHIETLSDAALGAQCLHFGQIRSHFPKSAHS